MKAHPPAKYARARKGEGAVVSILVLTLLPIWEGLRWLSRAIALGKDLRPQFGKEVKVPTTTKLWKKTPKKTLRYKVDEGVHRWEEKSGKAILTFLLLSSCTIQVNRLQQKTLHSFSTWRIFSKYFSAVSKTTCFPRAPSQSMLMEMQPGPQGKSSRARASPTLNERGRGGDQRCNTDAEFYFENILHVR